MSEKNHYNFFKKESLGLKFSLIVILQIFYINFYAQEYRALNGSVYAGSLASFNNPAAIIYMPNNIDVTPFAMQFKYTTNAMTITGSSYLPRWNKSNASLAKGTFERYGLSNVDFQFLNTRIRLNCKSAVSFGISGRIYQSAETSEQHWEDKISSVRKFMELNINQIPLSGNGRGIGWIEYHGTYARTAKLLGNAVLNTGVTLKLMNGVAGAIVNASELEFVPGVVYNEPGYYLTNGIIDYGYSKNLDAFYNASTFKEGLKGFFNETIYSVGISLGAEYIVSGRGVVEHGYPLRIGVSLLDIGRNNFKYSQYSSYAVMNKPNVSDSLIDYTFERAYDTQSFADSLESIAGSYSIPTGKFNLLLPARLVINVDKHLGGNFFLNSDITIPLAEIMGKKQQYVQEMNFVNLALRYEKSRIGLYLPVSLNTNMNLWVGGAIRTGPFIFGFHNLGNLISKSKIENGGAYFAMNFRIRTKKEFNCDFGIINSILNFRQNNQFKCPPVLN